MKENQYGILIHSQKNIQLMSEKEEPSGSRDDDMFFIQPYRMLSAHAVWIYDPDFWETFLVDIPPAVLKKAVPVFEGVPLQKDHCGGTDCNIGDVQNSRWAENTPGIEPPGINIDFRFNKLLDEKTVIRVQQGHVKCASAGFWYDYEVSHPELNIRDFIKFQGKKIDGQIVRRIMTALPMAREVSVVLLGADPTARQLAEMSKKFYTNIKPPDDHDRGKEDTLENKELKEKLGQMANMTVITDNHVTDAMTKIEDKLAQFAALETQNLQLTGQIRDLTPFKAMVEEETTALKERITGLATLTRGQDVEGGGKKLPEYEKKAIENASLSELREMETDFQAALMKEGKFKCPHCNEVIPGLKSSLPVELTGTDTDNDTGSDTGHTTVPDQEIFTTIHDEVYGG
jgi:hypothetical protein